MTNDEEHDRGWYGFDLRGELEGAMDCYQNDREDYLKNHPELVVNEGEGLAFEQAERFADAVMSGVRSLIQEPEEAFSDQQTDEERRDFLQKFHARIRSLAAGARRAAQQEGVSHQQLYKLMFSTLAALARPQDNMPALKLAWESLDVRLARQMIDGINLGVFRVLQLWELVLDKKPCSTTSSYLRFVSRSYISGYDPECIICCRSAVEAAFNGRVDDSMCEEMRGVRQEGYFTFHDRVAVAHKMKLISDGGKKKATNVRERANKAIHYDPDLPIDTFGTIRDSLAVIEELTSR